MAIRLRGAHGAVRAGDANGRAGGRRCPTPLQTTASPPTASLAAPMAATQAGARRVPGAPVKYTPRPPPPGRLLLAPAPSSTAAASPPSPAPSPSHPRNLARTTHAALPCRLAQHRPSQCDLRRPQLAARPTDVQPAPANRSAASAGGLHLHPPPCPRLLLKSRTPSARRPQVSFLSSAPLSSAYSCSAACAPTPR
jgi:hypothetical protein